VIFGKRSSPAAEPVTLLEADPVGPDGWLDQVTYRRVFVHTLADKTYEGILRATFTDGVVLVAARLVDKNDVDLAGEIFIPRDQIQVVQNTAAEKPRPKRPTAHFKFLNEDPAASARRSAS
jgi:hypothetical protein